VRFWVILDWTREEGRRRTSVANFEKEEDKRSHGRKRKKGIVELEVKMSSAQGKF
jgi:hypothetical protein